MKDKQKRSRGFTLVELLVVIVIIAALAGLSTPLILRQQKAADRTVAVNNAKQIGLALLEFDVEFGGYPDNYTAEEVSDSTGSDLNLSGNTSNDYFRQLVAFNVQTEDIFFADTPYTREPDNIIDGSEALRPGEVGFGYVMRNQEEGLGTSGNPNVPVVVAPLMNAQSNWTFDGGPFGDKAVILRADNSVDVPIVRKTDNYVTIGKGRTLQQTGPNSVWGNGITPVIKPPSKRSGTTSGAAVTSNDDSDFGN